MTSTQDTPSKVITPAKVAWEDQFKAPTLDEVREHYAGQSLDFFDRLLATLRDAQGLTEDFGWMGLPWRWAWSYRSEADAERIWAALVPDPEAPRLAIPLSIDQFESIPSRTLTRYLRDGIAGAVQVGEVRWPEWAVASPANLTDVLNLIKHKAKQTLDAPSK